MRNRFQLTITFRFVRSGGRPPWKLSVARPKRQFSSLLGCRQKSDRRGLGRLPAVAL